MLPLHSRVPLFLLVAILPWPSLSMGQEPPVQAGSDALRVYIDCASFRCDREQFRQEIEFVNWVREPQDAQVYVLMTQERAGGGGFRYSFDFEGREELEGLTDEFVHTSSITDVEDEVKEALTQTLRLGLVRYASAAGFRGDLEVTGIAMPVAGGDEEPQATPADDPWNFWVFSLNANVNFDEEDRRTSKNFGFGANANRTTEAWKINLRTNGNFRRDEFQLSDATVENNQDNWNVSSSVVKSLGDHMGVGVELEGNNSTRLNRDLLVAFGSGVEWNLFPFSESNRRVFLARYVMSVEHVNYQDTTVFDLLEETVYKHEVALDFETRGPWGNANLGIDAAQFLDRTDFWSFGVRGNIRYRIFRGLSINLNANYDVVQDQIFLPKESLSDEDILLGRISLPTESEFGFRIGFGYDFGSIFNNTVNSRFRRGVR